MGYDLIAKSKKAKIKDFSFGTISWPIFLKETGMGYVVGYGESMEPGSYNYIPRKKNEGSPVSNDGYTITSSQAKAMAMCARGFVSVKRFVNKQWEDLTEQERDRRIKSVNYNGKPLYNQCFAEEYLSKLENFADFAEQSGGFTIN